MKKTLTIIVGLSALLALAVPGHAQNICVNQVTYSDQQCIDPGTVDTIGELSYTTLDVCIGDPITPPTAGTTTFIDGWISANATNSCPEFSYRDGPVTIEEPYAATHVYFDPPIPSRLTTATTFQTTAKVDGIDPARICDDIIGIVLGTVTITSYGPPAFALQPTSKTAYVGLDVTFSSTATGRAPLSYQWYYNVSTPIASATDQNLVLPNVQLSQSGSYAVVVSDACGTITSSTAVLTLPSDITESDCSGGVPQLLGYWSFNPYGDSTYFGNRGQMPIAINNAVQKPSPFIRGLQIDFASSARLTYRYIDEDLAQNINCKHGAIRFWFSPNWDGGSGAGNTGRFIEMGNTNSALGWWGLSVDPTGSVVSFETKSNGVLTTCLTASISGWSRGDWHQVVLDYSATSTSLFVDGVIAATGTGVANYPALISRLTNGFSIGSDREGQFQIRGVIDELQTYNCPLSADQVHNDYLSASSLRGPTIKTPPASQTITLRETAAFSVVAVGTAPLSYQWRLNGGDISGATLSSYQKLNTQLSDGGTYTVVVANANGALTSDPAVLQISKPVLTINCDSKAVGLHSNFYPLTGSVSGVLPGDTIEVFYFTTIQSADTVGTYPITPVIVPQNGTSLNNYNVVTHAGVLSVISIPPTIVAQPQSQITIPGSTVTFNVSATGSQPLSYVWRFNGTAISGATDTSYTLANAQTAYFGSYSVCVANLYGTASSDNAILRFAVTPTILVQPVSTIINPGGTANFTVSASGDLLAYQWYFGGNPIPGATTSSLNLPNLWPTDVQDNYSVVVSNIAGTASSTNVTIAFTTAPVITQQPVSQTITLTADPIEFSIGVVGEPPLTYQWQFNGADIAGATLSSISIDSDANNAGSYSVVVGNAAGAVSSQFATLSVADYLFLNQPQSLSLPAGSTASFSVDFMGLAGAETYSWQKDGVPLSNSSRIVGADTLTLTIVNVSDADAGVYSLVVSTANWQATSADAVLTVDSFAQLGSWSFNTLADCWHADGTTVDAITGTEGDVIGGMQYQSVTTSNQCFAFGFDGGGDSDSYIDCGSHAGNFGTNDFTIDFWMNTARANEAVMGKREACDSGSMWEIRVDDPAVITMEVSGSTGDDASVSSQTQIADQTWHHIVFSRQGNALSVYVDGTLESSTTTTGVADILNSADVDIGMGACTGTDNADFFAGLLDEIKISSTPHAWIGDQGQQPLATVNLQVASSWDSQALLVNSTSPTLLSYRSIEANGIPNLSMQNGSVSFWFKPSWSSTGVGSGSGPHADGRFLEIGSLGVTNDWWSMFVNSNGTSLLFCTESNGVLVTNVSSDISWASGQWHQVVLTYSSTNSSIYIDGAPSRTDGSGVLAWPRSDVYAQGFSLGSDFAGVLQSKGVIDTVQTYNYPLDSTAVALQYADIITIDTDGDGVPDIVENQNASDPNNPNNPSLNDSNHDGVSDYVSGLEGRNPNATQTLPDTSGVINLQVFTPLKR